MPASDLSNAVQAQLLQQARDGDPHALVEIHIRFYPKLYRYALYRVGDSSVAQDIAADVFLRLLDMLRVGRAPQRSLAGWLFGVASHLVADYFRRLPRERASFTDALASSASTAVEAEVRLVHSQLRQAIRRLTPSQQEVLALRFGDGLSLEETADVMGKSVNAVKVLQFRATVALRKVLGELEE